MPKHTARGGSFLAGPDAQDVEVAVAETRIPAPTMQMELSSMLDGGYFLSITSGGCV